MPKPRRIPKDVLPFKDRTAQEQHKSRRVLDMKQNVPFNTKYDPYFHPNDIIEFFQDRYKQVEDPERYQTEKGQVGYAVKPVRPPTQAAYAAKIRVSPETLYAWAKRHSEFGEALDICKGMQGALLMELGTTGALNPAVTNFTLKNLQGWTDKVEETHKGTVALQFDAQDEDA